MRLSVPVRPSYYLSRVGQQGRAKEGEEPSLYLIHDPVGRNKLINRGWQRATQHSSNSGGGDRVPWTSPAQFSAYPCICGSLPNTLKVGASGDTRAVLDADSI